MDRSVLVILKRVFEHGQFIFKRLLDIPKMILESFDVHPTDGLDIFVRIGRYMDLDSIR